MRHCHRAASCDLFAEGEHHTAAAAQYVAKAHRHIRQSTLQRSIVDNQLGCTLGGTHHTGWVDGFVSGNHDEAFDAGCTRCSHNIACAQHIVGDCLSRVHLHEWHMLVRSCVEDDLRLVALKECGDAIRKADISNERCQLDVAAKKTLILEHQLVVHLEDRILTVAQEQQFCWTGAQNLAAQLATDRATATGDEYALAR